MLSKQKGNGQCKNHQLIEHVNNVCKSAYSALRNIGKIRKNINQDDCERLVHA